MARLGLKLYFLRTRERRLSQQHVADALGIRQATLSHLERGRSLPNHDVLRRVCEFFDVTPTWLLDDGRSFPPRPTERWSRRDALLTTGMWVELDPELDVVLPDGARLSPLAPGTGFYDGEAAGVRRAASDRETAERRLAAAADREAREAELLTDELERELGEHPRRRKKSRATGG